MQLPEVGELFEGRYRVDAILGEGGFARVYAATSDAVGREVAIKIVKPHASDGYDPTIVQRFLREARVMSQLRDPHTITMYDCGRSKRGLLYMVCELLPGADLSDLLEARGALSEAETVRILEQLLFSLREAHEAGLLHRDIKPSNIRVFEYLGDPLKVKLMDFGIAESTAVRSELTRDGQVMGTPRYMSPEALAGEEQTPASDIYSLGLVAHEMLTGADAMKLRVGRGRLEPSLRISPQVRATIEGMLQPDERLRLQTAREVLAALDGAPVRPRRAELRDDSRPTTVVEGPPDQVERSSDSGPNLLGVLAGVVLVALLVGGVRVMTNVNRSVGAGDHEAVAAPAPPSPTRAEAPRSVDADRIAPTLAELRQKRCEEITIRGLSEDHMVTGVDVLEGSTYVPYSFDPKSAPLILAVGEESVRKRMLLELEFTEIAETLGAVIVPMRLPSIPGNQILEFDKAQARVTSPVRRAIRAAANSYCIDESRVFMVASGEAATTLADYRCGMPLAAIITTGANVTPDHCEPQSDVPHLHLHMEQDLTTPRESTGSDCHAPTRPTYREMMGTIEAAYGCGESGGAPFETNCELRACTANTFAICHFDSGRLWQASGGGECTGRQVTDGLLYGPAVEAFLRKVAVLPTAETAEDEPK